MPVGCKVTLNGNHMWEFFDRFVSLAIPRIRDFRGLSPKSMDGRGNFAMGIKEQIIFHEIDQEKIKKLHGMDVIIITTGKTNSEGLALLEALGMPFRKDRGGN
jgi:large subunit ribosomal protein L5